jgi:biofilm PGA synthesis N-glycosyltransferase PgaC
MKTEVGELPRMHLPCSIGIMAYNEEANIAHLLETVVSQRTATVVPREIAVVASGCTDQTQAIVEKWTARDCRIRLIVQEQREGKASAVNQFLSQAREKIVVMCSGDLLLAPDTIEHLVVPFADPEIGMTNGRPVPVNNPHNFMGFAAHMLWNLHHQVNLNGFKAGELIAFRKIFERIPYYTSVDEANMEPIIRGQGYGVRYVSSAIVYNKGPETVKDFLTQRRRIYAGHLAIRDTLGYSVSTMNARKIFGLVIRNLDWRPRPFFWTCGVVAIEGYARLLGKRDYRNRRDHRMWDMAETTKQLKVKAS